MVLLSKNLLNYVLHKDCFSHIPIKCVNFTHFYRKLIYKVELRCSLRTAGGLSHEWSKGKDKSIHICSFSTCHYNVCNSQHKIMCVQNV